MFRKPTAPPPPQPTLQQQQLSAVRPAPLNSTFHQQIGQYFPKFTNRRGRQNRSRMMNNKFVGRQVLKPIQSTLMRPPAAIQTINVVASTTALTTATNNRNNSIILTPSPIILNANGTVGAGTGGVGGGTAAATATFVLAPAVTTAQLNHQVMSI